MTPAKKKAPVVDDGLSAFVASLPQRYEAGVELASLIEFQGNPKQHDLGAIITSIERNGMADVIKAQAATRYILGGHGTCAALRMMGWTHVPVLWIDCDDRTARRLVLAYNRTTELGGMDTMALADFLTPIADMGDLLGSGYDGEDVDALRIEAIGFVALPDGDKPPFEQMTFTLASVQADAVRRALRAMDACGVYDVTVNANSNGNALARLAERINAATESGLRREGKET